MTAAGLAETDPAMSKFLKDARSLQVFQGTDTRTIAVLGDSGQGKSSLINSLLHFPGVAETGDIGSACTSIVTEYRQKKPEHRAPITIEVEYLSTSGIKELVRELLWSYRQLFLPGVESSETSDRDYARYTRESEEAWSALQAAFKHKRQFTQKTAQDMSEGALERITDQLIEWTGEIEWPTGGVDGFWTCTAETAEECVEHTRLFMQDKYWPFTKIIRVYLNSHVLKTGVVLADLPGLQDTNLARVRSTQDYLVKCDNIIIVANISRAITDQSLKSSLFFALSRHVPTEWEQSGAQKFKIAVVCTKSEDINHRAARLEFCGPSKKIPPSVMTQLDEEIAAAKSSGDRTRKKAAKKKQELLLIQARNENVKQNLQSVYSSEMEGNRLDVFCVSNKWYEKYCPKGNTDFVQASGIPELRRFCHSLTADAQLNEARDFLGPKLSALLNSLNLWASSSLHSQEEIEVLDDSIYKELDKLVAEMPEIVGTFRREFSKCFQEQVMTFFARRDEHWDRAASTEGQKWTNWHHSQYNAWCLNNGNHETMKRGRENWNAKIIWKMRLELESQWDLVEEEVSDGFSAMLDTAKSLLVALKPGLRDSVPSQYADSLVNGIDCQALHLDYEIEIEERRFLEEVRAIRRYASEANYNSYILQDMMPVYRSAASQYGTGRHARQIEIVQGHIRDGIVFPQLSIAIASSMNNLVATAGKKLDDMFSNVLDSIRKNVDIVFRCHPELEKRPTIRDEERESRAIRFAGEVKNLTLRHERLLQSIESLQHS